MPNPMANAPRLLMFSLTLALLLVGAGSSVAGSAPASPVDSGTHLWRAWMLRAAPGRLPDLLSALESRRPVWGGPGAGAPIWMRHSQGDQWDVMGLFPVASLVSFDPEPDLQAALGPLVAWQEDLFALGPDPEVVAARLGGAGLYHVEMFRAVPGRRADLLAQRHMENAYLEAVGRPRNLVFTRLLGASWDLFTVGGHEDLEAFAVAGRVDPETDDRAARAAGFEAANQIGFFLRARMADHHDTLAVAIFREDAGAGPEEP